MYGKEIEKARLLAGYTQKEVSAGTGIPQNTISWIELDKGIENIYQCVQLANFFEISLDELIGRTSYIDENKKLNINNSFNNSNNSGNFNF